MSRSFLGLVQHCTAQWSNWFQNVIMTFLILSKNVNFYKVKNCQPREVGAIYLLFIFGHMIVERYKEMKLEGQNFRQNADLRNITVNGKVLMSFAEILSNSNDCKP